MVSSGSPLSGLQPVCMALGRPADVVLSRGPLDVTPQHVVAAICSIGLSQVPESGPNMKNSRLHAIVCSVKGTLLPPHASASVMSTQPHPFPLPPGWQELNSSRSTY